MAVERDEFDDPRDEALEADRELHASPYRDWGWPGVDDPRWSEQGIVQDSGVERDRDPEGLPKALEERARKDAALLAKIRGLEPDVWKSATFEQRLDTLREAERQLASLQGRVACRTYAVPVNNDDLGEMLQVTPEHVYSGSPYSWNGLAAGRYIHISERLLRCNEPETVVVVFAHESFHAYQTSVLWASEQREAAPELLRRYPEVDANTLAGWHKCMNQTPEYHYENLIEVHAEQYSWIVTERLYPGFWAYRW